MKLQYTEMSDFDYMRWTHNLLLKYGPTISDNPDFIIASPWRKHDFDDKVPTILITHENWEVFKPHYPLNKYYAVLGLFPPKEECNFVQFPITAAHFDLPIEFLYSEREKVIQLPKTEFCCFLCQNQVFGELAMPRLEFFKHLNSFRKVHSGGGVLNNIGGRVPRDIHALRWISHFKFMICFENSITPGYLTEKPFQAWFAGTIPIYVGDTTKLNSKAYLDARDPNIFERIKEIDSNEYLFKQMQSEELITPRISLEQFYKDFEQKVLNK